MSCTKPARWALTDQDGLTLMIIIIQMLFPFAKVSHMFTPLRRAKFLFLWPVRGQSVDRVEANVNHRMRDGYSPEQTGQDNKNTRKQNGSNEKQRRAS